MTYRIAYLESERGWGQKLEHGREFQNYDDAKAIFDLEMKQFLVHSEDKAPDYYFRPDHIEMCVDGKWMKFGSDWTTCI